MVLTLKIAQNQRLGKNKPIIIISKKIIKSSVKRNLLKRRIRNILKGYFLPPNHCFLVVINSPEAALLTFQDLQGEINHQLRKINFKNEFHS